MQLYRMNMARATREDSEAAVNVLLLGQSGEELPSHLRNYVRIMPAQQIYHQMEQEIDIGVNKLVINP